MLDLVGSIRRLSCIGWVGSVARMIRLANEGNVGNAAKEIIVFVLTKTEWVSRTGILSVVAWDLSPGRLSKINRILGISKFARVGSVASVYMVANNN